MDTIDDWEIKIMTFSTKDLIIFLQSGLLLRREFKCEKCGFSTRLVNYTRTIDNSAWRCYTIGCKNYKKYFSIRIGSFFEHLNIKLRDILRIILKYASRSQRFSIFSSSNVSNKTILKIINKIVEYIPETDFSSTKLGGPGHVVQIDETWLNHAIKAHRGRSPENKTLAITIVECLNGKIKRAYAKIIPDRKSKTLIPIICQQVLHNSLIWTDEHAGYNLLKNFNFDHQTVCHKHQFITEEGVNTQSVESFNHEIKEEITARNGVATGRRVVFLKEFCFLFNNKKGLFEAILNLIKC